MDLGGNAQLQLRIKFRGFSAFNPLFYLLFINWLFIVAVDHLQCLWVPYSFIQLNLKWQNLENIMKLIC